MQCRSQRAHFGRGIERIAELDRLREFHEAFHELLGDFFVQN